MTAKLLTFLLFSLGFINSNQAEACQEGFCKIRSKNDPNINELCIKLAKSPTQNHVDGRPLDPNYEYMSVDKEGFCSCLNGRKISYYNDNQYIEGYVCKEGSQP